MAFEKGNTLGTGRPKGSPNKIESTTKKFLQDLIDGSTDKIEAELKSLSGKAFLDAVSNFMEYVQPKLSRTELKAEIQEVEQFNVEGMSTDDLKELAEIKRKMDAIKKKY